MWRLINKGSNNHHYQNQKHHYTRDDTWWAAVTQWRCVPRKASLRARQIQLQTLQTSWQLLDEFLQTFLWDFTVGKVQLHLRPALATPISNLGGKTMIRLICQFLPKCSTKLHRNYILQFSAALPVATLRCKASKGDVKCGLKAHPAFKRSQDVWLLSSQVSQGQKKNERCQRLPASLPQVQLQHAAPLLRQLLRQLPVQQHRLQLRMVFGWQKYCLSMFFRAILHVLSIARSSRVTLLYQVITFAQPSHCSQNGSNHARLAGAAPAEL